MRFSKILCPIDFSSGSKHAMHRAVWLARETGAALVLAHAWEIPAVAFALETPFPADTMQRLIDDSQRALDKAVEEARAAGATQTTGTLLNGSAWARIVQELEVQKYDLCVIGTRGKTGLERVLLGSVAEMVVRHAPCSVLTVHPSGAIEPFRHALVPTDFSTSAKHALDVAANLIGPSGQLTLLHVIEVPVANAGELPSELARAIDAHSVAALEHELARIESQTKAHVAMRSRTGYPGAQTLAVLDQDRSVDLVVMGSHGRTGFKRMVLGSVAEKVVRHSHCAVLVTRL